MFFGGLNNISLAIIFFMTNIDLITLFMLPLFVVIFYASSTRMLAMNFYFDIKSFGWYPMHIFLSNSGTISTINKFVDISFNGS